MLEMTLRTFYIIYDKRIMSITNIPELVAVSEKSIAGIEIAAPRLHGEDAHSMHHAHVPAY
jgi:hypothetical protein